MKFREYSSRSVVVSEKKTSMSTKRIVFAKSCRIQCRLKTVSLTFKVRAFVKPFLSLPSIIMLIIRSLSSLIMLTSNWAPFSKVPAVTGLEILFFVWHVYIQHRDVNSYEIQTIKISGRNEIE